MNEKIKNLCDEIIANRNALKKSMRWEVDSNTYAVMAGILTASKGVQADSDKYKKCKEILHKHVNAFSEVRGTVQAVVIVKMMMCEDPEAYALGVIEIYKKLRSIHKLTASPYMVMAAMNIYEHVGVDGADADIEKLENVYKELKKQHPLLISDEDRGYLSMLVGAGADIDRTVERIEASYEACKKISIDKNAVHSLAQVLALSEMNPEMQMEFVSEIIEGLKKNKTRISKDYGLTILGAMAMLNMPTEQLISDITEASNYLKGKDGFKFYNVTKGLRTTYAAIAVFTAYADDCKISSVINTNIAMNIVEEIILMMTVAVITTTTAAASSASN